MPIEIKSTKDFHNVGLSLIVYGQSGTGKTTLISTLPDPIILSAETGLLSLTGHDLPYIQINSVDDLYDAYSWLKSNPEAQKYQSIALDSISDIAEVILANEKKNNKDVRAAYGETADRILGLIRAFRDLPKITYFVAKLEKQQDETGKILYYPSLPGNKAAQALPYFFDGVYALRVEKGPDGNPVRVLQTQSDGVWLAKDRSNKDVPNPVEMWESPNLGAIIKKIKGEV